MKKIITLTLFCAMCLLCGCRHLSMMSPETGEVVKLVTHSGSHKAWATMPDGEVLEGKFAAMPEGSVGYGFGSATAFGGGSSATAFGSGTSVTTGSHGTFYVLLKSTKPGSKLMMEIAGVYDPLNASGVGQARTNDGRTYKIVF